MKKITLFNVIGLLMDVAGAVFLVLSVFTDINDRLFLPLSLACILVANVFLMTDNIKRFKNIKSKK